MPPSSDDFVADAALRFDLPPAPQRRRARRAAAVLIALGVELAVFAVVWFEREYKPPVELAEIPVEIVVEPPPPPPPPEPTPTATPEPEAKPQQPDLTPGIDAPREGKSEHETDQVGEEEKPAEPPPSPAPTPSPEATTPAAEAPSPELPKAAEAEAPPPLKAEETPQPAAPSQPTVAEILAKALAAPQIDAGMPAMKAPISGGKAKATYLSILYGLTKSYERIPAAAYTYSGRLVGVINVSIDGNGRMLTRYVAQSSGSPELDEAEMRAVAEASHKFPPPPGHVQIDLSYTYGLK